MLDDSVEQRRALEERLREQPEKWVHHVADLDLAETADALELDRPIGLDARLERVRALWDIDLPVSVFSLYERRLTPRYPYQAIPLSYLNTPLGGWTLWGEIDLLQWSHSAAPGRAGSTSGSTTFPSANLCWSQSRLERASYPALREALR